ncbi:3-deoxy-D-manno-octulosonic acid transferase [Cetobacterium somerae]|uniref:3-deoxy-D-manno-octulosonic acid transferase n=1 Tax=Cetobacterium sp. NK01 TaxID=2993530 RepID=UPI002116478A|nr:glycosyltransferase N-terminal domain-containing protein [Cetobacterium sp. NK01]MCQ8212553.1 3-deoxy-D-manno-octulosonic acid transferase [Cetobacterium sp. NK01]
MFYNLLRGFLYPFLFIILIFKPKKLKFVCQRLYQDLSLLKKSEKYVWIHCSSVGEINLTDALIKKLKDNFEENILITVFTDTGYEIAMNKYLKDDRISILRFPLDDFFILKRIFKYIKVTKIILVETEIWPNFINLGSKYSKIFIVNGRISNKSFPRYKKILWLIKPLFSKINGFFMQSQEDKNRIIELGANKNKVFVTGNLKFDISFETFSSEQMSNLKELIKSDSRKIFVAGSTRQGEDSILIDIFKNLKNTLLVIVPRHLERVPEIEELIKSSDLTYEKLTNLELSSTSKNFEILIVDKMGVLRKFYSIADISFVGGTLVNIGGHSLLEPLFYGKTPIFGPYLQNVKDISKDILNLNIGYKVNNKEEFLNTINLLETNPVSEDKIKAFFKSNQNAAEKTIKFMEEE